MISLDQVKQLREKTNFSIMECKKALEKTEGNETKALELLNAKSAEKAEKKSEREAGQGVVDAYVHNNGKVGVLLKLNCETDFVAKNEDFKALAHDIAMQIAAIGAESKDELLKQEFIKDPQKTIQDLITEMIGKLGENIQLGEFVRMEV